MRYGEELIEEIRARNDIVDVIGESVKLKRTGRNYVGLCPFHSEKTASFSVSPDRQLYYCFGCHAAGNVYTYVMQYQNASFTEAIQILADRAGIALPVREETPQEKEASDRKEAQLSVMRKAAAYYIYKLKTKQGEYALSYLRKRGLSDDTIRSFGLGYAGKYSDELFRYLKKEGFSERTLMDSGLFNYSEREGYNDRFWNRVMFPICDVRGRVIGFGGRVMGDGKPKYLNSPETELFNKRWNLFGMQIARSSCREHLALCEGYLDAISMHQAGFPYAVASLGTALTEQQARLMARYTKEILLMYDSDGAGVNAAVRAVPILMEAGLVPKVVNLAPYKDPDELLNALGAEEMQRRIDSAENGFLFTVDQLAKEYNFSDPQSKTAFERAAAVRLLTFSDELERNNYTEAVCARYHTPSDSMKRLIARLAAQGTPAENYTPPRSGVQPVKDDGKTKPQKLMLSYLAAYPEAYAATKDMIGPEDFTDPLCRKIADLIYPQCEAGRVSEAHIISAFPDLEEQKEAAAVFHDTVPYTDASDADRAFTDTVIKLMKQSNRAHMDAWNGDLAELDALMKEKARIERLMDEGTLIHINTTEGV